MAYIVQQQDIDILLQSSKTIFSKVELLNKDFKVVDVIQGNVINDNFVNDSLSDVRRTYNVTLKVNDSTFTLSPQSKIWVDKYIRPYIGILHTRKNEILWYCKGTYSWTNLNYEYSETSNTLSLTCEDLMTELTGSKDGQTDGLKLTIPAESNIRKVIIQTITQLGKVKKYRVDDIEKTIPYDLEFSAGTNTYDILKQINDLYSGWEFFFDIDGTFIWQEIPNCDYDDIILDDAILKKLVIKESISCPLNFKNVTEVWGKCLESDRFAQTCTFSNNIYTVGFINMEELGTSLTYAMTVPTTNGEHSQVHIIGDKEGKSVDLGTFPIIVSDVLDEKQKKKKIDKLTYQVEVLVGKLSTTTNEEDKIKINTEISSIKQKIKDINEQKLEYLPTGSLTPNTTYIIQYKNKKMYYQGQFQIHAIFKNEYPDCPLSVKNLGREIWDIKSGGDYDKIYSDDLAMQRAKLENHLTTIFQDTISIEMLDIPWLEVNKKIKYTTYSTNETHEYLIKTINSTTIDGTMSVTLIKFYEDWTVSV